MPPLCVNVAVEEEPTLSRLRPADNNALLPLKVKLAFPELYSPTDKSTAVLVPPNCERSRAAGSDVFAARGQLAAAAKGVGRVVGDMAADVETTRGRDQVRSAGLRQAPVNTPSSPADKEPPLRDTIPTRLRRRSRESEIDAVGSAGLCENAVARVTNVLGVYVQEARLQVVGSIVPALLPIAKM